MKNKVYKYYLTKSNEKEILSGHGWYWERVDEDGYDNLTHSLNLAKSWNSKEDLLEDIKESQYKIVLFIDNVFSKFLDY